MRQLMKAKSGIRAWTAILLLLFASSAAAANPPESRTEVVPTQACPEGSTFLGGAEPARCVPSFYKRYLAPNRIPAVALSPSLWYDSALKGSVGVAILTRVFGDCGHACGGHFVVANGEVGMHGQQVRLGYSVGYVAPVLTRYLILNGVGGSLAVAYLRRTETFAGSLARPENYLGANLGFGVLVSVRVGAYQQVNGGSSLFTAAIGFGF